MRVKDVKFVPDNTAKAFFQNGYMLYILSDSAAGKFFLRMMLTIIELIFFDRLFSIIGTFSQNRDQIETNFSHFPQKVSIRDHR